MGIDGFIFQSESFVGKGVTFLVIDVKWFTTIYKILVLFCNKCKVKCTYMFMTIGAIRYPYGHIS